MISKLSLFLIFAFFSFSLSSQADTLIRYAKTFLGVPYCWGGETPACFDCSGFCQYVYKHALGIDISRTTIEILNEGREVSREELQPGDLIFPDSGHVALYIGDNKIIHAPKSGDVVKIVEIYEFWRARRILEDDKPTKPSIDTFKAVFDAEFYSRKYKDLKNAFGNDNKELSKHFYSFGIKEGRTASPAFDVKYYLNNNDDLKKYFGSSNYVDAFNHFISKGWIEDRDLSPVFHIYYYKVNNPGVVKEYGEDNTQAIMNHFLVFGMKEGRKSSPYFNLQAYKKNNKDLVKKFGDDNKEYYIHYLLEGKEEGRKAT